MNQVFCYRDAHLVVEEVRLADVVAQVGTPCYVYSRAAIEERWVRFDRAFGAHPHRVCYAVKANSTLAVLGVLARLGSGFDIVSAGELGRVLAAGGAADGVVFSGVGKTRAEIEAALHARILCFNAESAAELERLQAIGVAHGQRIPVSLRVNPDVDAKTHPYIATGLRDSKFGIPLQEARELARIWTRWGQLDLVGLDCHIGSQITALGPYEDALRRVLEFAGTLTSQGFNLRHLDIGGGLGVRYRDEEPPAPEAYVAMACQAVAQSGVPHLEILIEPGRAIVAEAGVLLTRVEYLKQTASRHLAIVDAGMNDLLRPALYGAWHPVEPLERRAGPSESYDIVGPVCESADVLASDRRLVLKDGDVLALGVAGAYGMSMASNYNSRPLPAEVMVDGNGFTVVRARQTETALWAGERLLEGGPE